MGRFRDKWASGKNVLSKNQQEILMKGVPSSNYAIPAPTSDPSISEPCQQIIAALKPRRGAETGRWLSSLSAETVSSGQQSPAAGGSTAGGDGFVQMTIWVDCLFAQFAELSYEFNKTAIGTDLLIAGVPPQLSEKKAETSREVVGKKFYQGRLTTRDWALVIKGMQDDVSVFILPSSMLLAFETGAFGEQDAAPFMQICYSANTNDWTIDGERAPLETAPHLAKELLGDLIRVASGKMAETELFSAHHEAPKLGETMAVGYTPENKVTPSIGATELSGDELNVFDACDLVDKSIDAELKRLYQHASTLQPGSSELDTARKQISAIETFHAKMMEAFF